MSTDYKDIVNEETDREAYECVLRLMDKAIEWGEKHSQSLIDMLVEQMDNVYSTNSKKLYRMYRYLLKLVMHLKNNPDYSELNRLTDNGDSIEVYAYDYKTFCWCLDNKMDKGLGNGVLYLYKDSIPTNVYNNLLKRIKK